MVIELKSGRLYISFFSPGVVIFAFSRFIYKLNGAQMAYSIRIRDRKRRFNDFNVKKCLQSVL